MFPWSMNVWAHLPDGMWRKMAKNLASGWYERDFMPKMAKFGTKSRSCHPEVTFLTIFTPRAVSIYCSMNLRTKNWLQPLNAKTQLTKPQSTEQSLKFSKKSKGTFTYEVHYSEILWHFWKNNFFDLKLWDKWGGVLKIPFFDERHNWMSPNQTRQIKHINSFLNRKSTTKEWGGKVPEVIYDNAIKVETWKLYVLIACLWEDFVAWLSFVLLPSSFVCLSMTFSLAFERVRRKLLHFNISFL